MSELLKRLKSSSPKKILSLDGGGIRGALTLGYLKRIETILRKKENNPNLLLCDYFDLIGGTSTGAIIASALAIGMSVDEIKDKYMKLGGRIFSYRNFIYRIIPSLPGIIAKYNHKILEKELEDIFGNITIGSDKIKTGLCIVAKRADTNSIWPIINHPEGKFYDSEYGKNKNIFLWKAIRASSAAPTYFKPVVIDVGDWIIAPFIDGGVSMANNPALTLLKISVLKSFPFRWKYDEENLAIVSVGTGYSIFNKHRGQISRAWIKTWASNVPDMLMQDASWQNQIVLQWLSESPTAYKIDMEMGDLAGDLILGKPSLKYLRYNFPLTENDLNGLGLENEQFDEKRVNSLIEMSNANNRELLYAIGEKSAASQIKEKHFIEYL
jgi:patatin-like phospholipase/acyl hydrolase